MHARLWMDGVSGGMSPSGRPRETLPSEDCMLYGMHCVVLYVACDGGGGLARHSQHWLCRAKNTLMNSMLFNSGRSVPCAMLAQWASVYSSPRAPHQPASEFPCVPFAPRRTSLIRIYPLTRDTAGRPLLRMPARCMSRNVRIVPIGN